MNYVWAGMILLSVITAAFTGRGQEVGNAVMSGAQDAVALFAMLLGMNCLWGGLSAVAERAGLTAVVSRLFRPFMKRLFPRLGADSPAVEAMSMNITANLLGLGNAATPLGLEAMKRLQAINPNPLKASDEMVTFVIMNTSCLQLIPMTIAMLRRQNGAENPMDILFAVWLCSLASLLIGLLAARLMGVFGRKKY